MGVGVGEQERKGVVGAAKLRGDDVKLEATEGEEQRGAELC